MGSEICGLDLGSSNVALETGEWLAFPGCHAGNCRDLAPKPAVARESVVAVPCQRFLARCAKEAVDLDAALQPKIEHDCISSQESA